jgi:hypothetical protein
MVYQKMKHATLLLLLLLVTIAAVFVLEHFASSWRNQNCNQPMEFQQRIPIRVINRPLFDYRPDIATRVERLVLANAMADEPEVVRLARDVIETPPKEAWSSPIKQSHMIIQTPQARKIDELTSNKVSKVIITMHRPTKN